MPVLPALGRLEDCHTGQPGLKKKIPSQQNKSKNKREPVSVRRQLYKFPHVDLWGGPLSFFLCGPPRREGKEAEGETESFVCGP